MSNWREVGMYVERRGGGSSLQKWTVQVWEATAPVGIGRRIVVAEFCYESEGETKGVFRLISQGVTSVEAVQLAAQLFAVPALWGTEMDGRETTLAALQGALADTVRTFTPAVSYLLTPA